MKKKKSVNLLANKFSNIFFLVSVTLLIVYLLLQYNKLQMQYEMREQAREFYVEVQNMPTPLPTNTLEPSAVITPTTEPEPTEEPAPTPKRILPEFSALREEYNNDDIIGFIEIEGTSVSYPVVQSADNDYYLTHNIGKNKDNAGWIYMDYENDVSKEDKNTIIYGHNMNADIMFHSLRNYTDKEFFETHRYITFNTIYDSYTWEVFSFYKTSTDFYYIQVHFANDEFETLLNEMKSRSAYDTGVEVTKDDRILTLSTCSNLSDDSRYVVNARLVQKNSD